MPGPRSVPAKAASALPAVVGGGFVPAALLIAAAHFAAGMMVAYYSRGEGPR